MTQEVSTHASLAGRDRAMATRRAASFSFYPRVPCGTRQVSFIRERRFKRGFYPRVPCGTRLLPGIRRPGAEWFLPTRPLRDATISSKFSFQPFVMFLPTRPLRDATGLLRAKAGILPVSTHASLAGRDDVLEGKTGYAQGVSTHASLAGRDSSG